MFMISVGLQIDNCGGSGCGGCGDCGGGGSCGGGGGGGGGGVGVIVGKLCSGVPRSSPATTHLPRILPKLLTWRGRRRTRRTRIPWRPRR